MFTIELPEVDIITNVNGTDSAFRKWLAGLYEAFKILGMHELINGGRVWIRLRNSHNSSAAFVEPKVGFQWDFDSHGAHEDSIVDGLWIMTLHVDRDADGDNDDEVRCYLGDFDDGGRVFAAKFGVFLELMRKRMQPPSFSPERIAHAVAILRE